MEPGRNIFGPWDHPFCEKCGRYYSKNAQHICNPDEYNVEDERRKLRKWLGEYTIVK